MNNHTYLGDGVYVEFTGWSVVLKANSHTNPTDTIELEHSVIQALFKFSEKSFDEKLETE
ncbi:MAG: hypothetical protein KAS32_14555 [Candidatus Peribacteraceae bacterium]|nr:hypothetical protein [Candidatus Peribacteraceae bacterium]